MVFSSGFVLGWAARVFGFSFGLCYVLVLIFFRWSRGVIEQVGKQVGSSFKTGEEEIGKVVTRYSSTRLEWNIVSLDRKSKTQRLLVPQLHRDRCR